MSRILFRSDLTGGAWWPLSPINKAISFDDEQEYLIYGTTYTVDTTVFRDARENAISETTWDELSKAANVYVRRAKPQA